MWPRRLPSGRRGRSLLLQLQLLLHQQQARARRQVVVVVHRRQSARSAPQGLGTHLQQQQRVVLVVVVEVVGLDGPQLRLAPRPLQQLRQHWQQQGSGVLHVELVLLLLVVVAR
jgi:hypothetical protein